MYGVSKFIALILAFCLGFSCCGGMLIGGAVVALDSFRVRDLEKHGIAEIPDELFMGSEPVVDLLNLTAFEFYNEMKTVTAMGDKVTIDFLQNRYDLKIPASAEKFLNDEARKMPIKSLFSEEGVKQLLSTVYIGYVQSFECHKLDSTEPANPADGKDAARWYNPTKDEYVTGINETLAFISLGDFVSGKVDVQEIIGSVHIGDALGYYPVYDELTGKDVWYEKGTNEPATGVLSAFIDCTVDNIDDKIDNLLVGEIFGYEKAEDGFWYQRDADNNLVKVDGIIGYLSDSYVNDIDTALEEATIGQFFGYTCVDEENDLWVDEDGKPVTGILGILAGSNMDGVDEAINEAQIGVILDYQQNSDGEWCEYNSETHEYDIPVGGFMGKIADCCLAPDPDDPESKGIDDVFSELEIGDIVDEEDRTGIFAIVEPSTKIDNIGDAINDSISESPMQFFMSEGLIEFDEDSETVLDGMCLMNGGEDVIKLKATDEKYLEYYDFDGADWTKEGEYYLIPAWRDQPLTQSFSYIVNLLTTPVTP